MEEKPQILQASPWLDGGADATEKIFSEYPAREFQKGHIFYCQEENTNFVYLLCEGRVCLSIDSMNGEAKDIFIADKGFLFGKLSAFDCMPNCCSAIVVSETATVRLIPKAIFTQRLDCDPHFCRAVLAMLSRTVRTLISQIRLLSFSSSRARVSYALYHLVRQYSSPCGDGLRIDITFTHQEIAHLVAMSRVSVSNILSAMAKDGIIRKKDGHYYVQNPEALYQAVLDEMS